MAELPADITIDDVAAWLRKCWPEAVEATIRVTADDVSVKRRVLAPKEQSGRSYSMRTLSGDWAA